MGMKGEIQRDLEGCLHRAPKGGPFAKRHADFTGQPW